MDTILKLVPFEFASNACSAELNPFIEEIPLPADVTENEIEFEE
jgi:hypothetical protein